MKRPVLLLSFVLVLLASGCATCFREPQDIRHVIQSVQKKVFPTLVFVKPIKQQFGSGELTRQQVLGSGVIISPDGLVVTNSHVAKDSVEIKCVLYNSEQFPAHVVGVDADTDLALLKLRLPSDHAPLPVAAFGDSDALQEGEFVMAFGSPLGFARSISFGVVSCTRRYLDIGAYNLWIQTDAAINPGNSGGPLVNDRGEVIGINTVRAAFGENLGFAIPSNTVRAIAGQLQAHGRVERAYFGIQLQPIKDFIRDVILDYDRGVLVAGVEYPSPAAAAGLKAGDLVLTCAGVPVNGIFLEDMPSVRTLFAAQPSGQECKLLVLRDNTAREVIVRPTEKPQLTSEGVELEAWNCSVQEISKFRTPVLAYFAPTGAYVLGVRKGGNAQSSGLQPGDILLTVDGKPVADLAALQEIYRQSTQLERGKRMLLIETLRGGYRHFLVLDFNREVKRGSE
jgi:S1-C subfamily serine protease